jgi:cytochrome c biogenesis protein CcdA
VIVCSEAKVGQVLFGPVLLTSLLAGMVALLAPCCVSVMLPAYLATVFRRRAGILAATVVFGLGVATVIVPIGLGASALSAVFQRWHTPIFATGGAAMLAGGAAVLLGWSPTMPMPGGRAPTGRGVGAVYGLGVFSGVASACCAPVLVGVSVLAGATASFPAALTVAGAYVVGMVAPLLAMSLGWERLGTAAAHTLQARRVPLYPGARRRPPLGGFLSGLLLVGMGILTIVLAITGPHMPTAGWRVTFTAGLQHTTSVVGKQLHWLPGWAVAVVLVAAMVGIGVAVRNRTTEPTHEPEPIVEATEPAAAAATATSCCTEPTTSPTASASLPTVITTDAGVAAGPTHQDDTHAW